MEMSIANAGVSPRRMYSFAPVYERRKGMRKPGMKENGERRSLLRSDVVRNVDAQAGVCFRKCRCGSQAAPYEIISILRRVWDGEVKRGWRREIAARLQELLEKLIIFPVS